MPGTESHARSWPTTILEGDIISLVSTSGNMCGDDSNVPMVTHVTRRKAEHWTQSWMNWKPISFFITHPWLVSLKKKFIQLMLSFSLLPTPIKNDKTKTHQNRLEMKKDKNGGTSGSSNSQSLREIPMTSAFLEENNFKQSHPNNKINSYLPLTCIF